MLDAWYIYILEFWIWEFIVDYITDVGGALRVSGLWFGVDLS